MTRDATKETYFLDRHGERTIIKGSVGACGNLFFLLDEGKAGMTSEKYALLMDLGTLHIVFCSCLSWKGTTFDLVKRDKNAD